MKFYLGAHEPHWLKLLDIPLMVSRNRLNRLVKLPRATCDWVLDSGGFTELQQHGHWRSTAKQFAENLERFTEIGRLEWCAPQDWMCEPLVIHGGTPPRGHPFVGTGLSVAEHQARTVGNYLDLMDLGAPVIPVLQGYSIGDYEHCVTLYENAGVDLTALPTVGLGSVCRRENTDEIGRVVTAMHDHGIQLHGFGCKTGALKRYGGLLASADSMSWSLGGRQRGTCEHLKSRCANHLHWALDWRDGLVGSQVYDARMDDTDLMARMDRSERLIASRTNARPKAPQIAALEAELLDDLDNRKDANGHSQKMLRDWEKMQTGLMDDRGITKQEADDLLDAFFGKIASGELVLDPATGEWVPFTPAAP